MTWPAVARIASASMNSIAVIPPNSFATSRMPGSSSARCSGGMVRASRASDAPHSRENTRLVSGRSGSCASTVAPASARMRAACSTAAMPSASTGASKPGRDMTATDSPSTPSSIPSRQSRGSSGRQNGSRASKRAMAENISAASRTVRVIGPAQETEANALDGHCGMRP